ncbi:MAG: hypothetical protein HY937_03295 [Nitrosomonadales bacterium]|nr:hypothetical protein [Nitrosomonadales bacterium]
MMKDASVCGDWVRCEDAGLPGLSFGSTQYLNWDVLADRAVLQRQSWNLRAELLVMDEIHKMPNWNEKC